MDATRASEDVQVTVLLTSEDVPSEKFAIVKNCLVPLVAIDATPGETCSDKTVGVLLDVLLVLCE
jgi:hypothetical protein